MEVFFPAMLRLEEMRRPPYSPDLAPSDYHLFPNVEEQPPRTEIFTDDVLKYTRPASG